MGTAAAALQPDMREQASVDRADSSPSTTAYNLLKTSVSTVGNALNFAEGVAVQTRTLVNEAVPATARFVGSFFLPEVLNNILSSALKHGTALATGISSKAAEAGINVTTFGTPSMIKCAHRLLGSQDTDIGKVLGDSRQFIADMMVADCSRPIVQNELKLYLQARKELNALQGSQQIDAQQIAAVQHRLIELETGLRSVTEFQTLKTILERGADAITDKFAFIEGLAERTANRVVEQAEEALGGLPLRIEGKSYDASDPAQRTKALGMLRSKISADLQEIMRHDLSSAETERRLSKACSKLRDAYGTYQEARAAIAYGAMGVLWASGALLPLLKTAAGSAFSLAGSASSALWKGVLEPQIAALTESIGSSLTGFASHIWESGVASAKYAIVTGLKAVTPPYMHPWLFPESGTGTSVEAASAVSPSDVIRGAGAVVDRMTGAPVSVIAQEAAGVVAPVVLREVAEKVNENSRLIQGVLDSLSRLITGPTLRW